MALAVYPNALNSGQRGLFIAVAAAGVLAVVSCALAQDAHARVSPNPAQVSVFDMPAILSGERSAAVLASTGNLPAAETVLTGLANRFPSVDALHYATRGRSHSGEPEGRRSHQPGEGR